MSWKHGMYDPYDVSGFSEQTQFLFRREGSKRSQPSRNMVSNLPISSEAWWDSKVSLKLDEVSNKRWVKQGEHGEYSIITFIPSGNLLEQTIDSEKNTWEGLWRLELIGGRMALIGDIGGYHLEIFAEHRPFISGTTFHNGQPHGYYIFYRLEDIQDSYHVPQDKKVEILAAARG